MDLNGIGAAVLQHRFRTVTDDPPLPRMIAFFPADHTSIFSSKQRFKAVVIGIVARTANRRARRRMVLTLPIRFALSESPLRNMG